MARPLGRAVLSVQAQGDEGLVTPFRGALIHYIRCVSKAWQSLVGLSARLIYLVLLAQFLTIGKSKVPRL